ncbi:hypothetical protein [Gilvimarinus agarilyticus]|uniref:hypothetical protein n=1 Tax=Gilvimarinus agarilyticus TaxID=679259 RepID=UPI0005A28A82|nr:hypothetical protein [Gilvimarinus agarilyticus]
MNKTLMALCLLSVAAAGLWFALDSAPHSSAAGQSRAAPDQPAPIAAATRKVGHNPGTVATVSAAHANSTPTANNNAIDNAQPSFEERLGVMQQRRPNRHYDEAEVRAAVQRDSAWSSETPDNLDELPLESEALNDGRQIITFDPLKLETLMPGDQVKVSIDETGEQYTVNINRIEQHDYHSISWYGEIDGNDGQTYQVSFTQGDTLTVGGLSTPDGNYQLQAHGDAGWIASSASLFKVQEGQTDAIVPGELKH